MKRFFQKLKIIYAFNNVIGYLHLILLECIFLIYIVSKNEYIFLLPFIFFGIILVIKNKQVLFTLVPLLIVIVLGICIKNIKYKQFDGITYYEGITKVYSVNSYDDYQKVFISSKKGKLYFIATEKRFLPGDKIYIKGIIEKVAKEHIPNGFNYYEYLKYKGVYGKIKIEEVDFLKHQFSFNYLHEIAYQQIKKNYDKKYSEILASLTIGEKHNLNEELKDNINIIGIGHLFVISGMHINMLIGIICFILSKFNVDERKQKVIIIIVLLFYYWLTAFLISILRVIISFIMNKFLGKYFSSLKKLDKLSLNALIVLLINPFFIFDYSFKLTYLITFGLLGINRFLRPKKGLKSSLYNMILTSVTSLVISLPIIIKINPSVNLLLIFYNIIYIPLVTYIILPFSFLVLLIRPSAIFYKWLISFFLFLIELCSKCKYFSINFASMNYLVISLYYLFFLLIIGRYSRKTKFIVLILSILLLIVNNNKMLTNLKNEVYFFDLPTGDATLICKHNNLTNILIDTGDIDSDSLLTFLKNKGIKRLDAIIISHGDSDHIGMLKPICENFKVKTIFLSYYDKSSYEYVLKEKINVPIYYLKKGDEFKISDLKFKVLWPSKTSEKTNNNSLVIYAEIFLMKYLFTGDIEEIAEKAIVEQIHKLNVDVLKVAHHGSVTSSSITFLNNISFNIAIAMNGYNNNYDFPSPYIVKRFEKYPCTFYNTKYVGTVIITNNHLNNKVKIRTTNTDKKCLS